MTEQQESQQSSLINSQEQPSIPTQKQERNPFIRLAERVFHGRPEETYTYFC